MIPMAKTTMATMMVMILLVIQKKCMEGSNKACRHNRAVSNGKHSAGLKRPWGNRKWKCETNELGEILADQYNVGQEKYKKVLDISGFAEHANISRLNYHQYHHCDNLAEQRILWWSSNYHHHHHDNQDNHDYDDYDQTTTTSLVLWWGSKMWAKPGLTTTWQKEGAAGRG